MEFGMCSDCYSGGPEEIVAFVVAFLVMGGISFVFYYVVVYLPARFLLGAAGGFVGRFLWESEGLLDAGAYVLEQVALHRGGKPEWAGPRTIVYRIPDSNVVVHIRRLLDTSLEVRLPNRNGFRRIPGTLDGNSPARWLRRAGFRVRFRPEFVRVGRKFRAGEMLPGNVENLLKACHDLQAFLDHYVEIGVAAKSTANEEEHCAFCKGTLGPGEAYAHCKQCGAAHHPDCFRLYSRCSVFGCAGTSITA